MKTNIPNSKPQILWASNEVIRALDADNYQLAEKMLNEEYRHSNTDIFIPTSARFQYCIKNVIQKDANCINSSSVCTPLSLTAQSLGRVGQNYNYFIQGPDEFSAAMLSVLTYRMEADLYKTAGDFVVDGILTKSQQLLIESARKQFLDYMLEQKDVVVDSFYLQHLTNSEKNNLLIADGLVSKAMLLCELIKTIKNVQSHAYNEEDDMWMAILLSCIEQEENYQLKNYIFSQIPHIEEYGSTLSVLKTIANSPEQKATDCLKEAIVNFRNAGRMAYEFLYSRRDFEYEGFMLEPALCLTPDNITSLKASISKKYAEPTTTAESPKP